MKHVIRSGVLLVLLLVAGSARAQSLEILGYAGILGEWELTANVAGTGDARSYAGPLLMRHVGICTQDGPEEKTGSIRVQLSQAMRSSQPPPHMSATLRVDGVTCTYSGRLSDSYAGTMNCPDRAPVPLQIWLK